MTTLSFTRTVAVPPQDAFDAWVDPTRLATWWWPHLSDTTYAVDAREGGTLAIGSPTAGIGVRGEFLAVEPASLLRFTWNWVNDGEVAATAGGDVVEVRFAAVDNGTEVTVEHTSDEHVTGGGAEQGWNDVLDRYAAIS